MEKAAFIIRLIYWNRQEKQLKETHIILIEYLTKKDTNIGQHVWYLKKQQKVQATLDG